MTQTGESVRGRHARRALAVTAAALGGSVVLAASVLAMLAASASPAPAASTAGGTLRAWGLNSDGDLGDNSTKTRHVPVTVKLPPGATVTSVRAGCDNSVAVTAAGGVLAWGLLSNVGHIAAVTHEPFPIRLPLGTTARTARAGCSFTLILTTDGRVLAWGENGLGQLGDGSTDNRAVPVQVQLGAKATAISTGCKFGLALTSAGKLLAWGDNTAGQLGDGSTGGSDVPVPVALPGGTRIRAVSAGCDFALALTTTGKVMAWGDNSHGQLGDGTTGGHLKPVTVHVALPGTGQISSLFAGCSHSLALTSAGKILAWGYNAYGQLGNGATKDRHKPVQVKLPTGTHATSVTASCFSSLALTSAGRILAWGDDSEGQLGDGGAGHHAKPVRVHLAAGLVPVALGGGPDALDSFAVVRRAR
jgi:alpha-tubulin suppressor-like RCC1 family protein